VKSKIFVTLMWGIVFALCSNGSVLAQGVDPFLPRPVVGDSNAFLSASSPDAVATTVPVGQPGLSYRYVRTFGETKVAYVADTQHLNYPYGIGTIGNSVWIGEKWGNRLLKYDSAGNFQMQFGRARFADSYEDTSFWEIEDVAEDSEGNVWVVDPVSNRVVKLSPTGQKLLELGEMWVEGSSNTQFIDPMSVAIDASNNIYVSDGGAWWNPERGNHRIQVFRGDGAYLTTIGNTGQCGFDDYSFCGPRHIAIFGNMLYVADAGAGRVQMFNISNPTSPTYVASIDNLNTPSGVAVDAAYIYVADTWANQVKIYNRVTYAFVATIGSTSGANNNQLHNPTDVAVDAAGNLYVADFVNTRVQQFTRSGATWNYARTYGVTGTPYVTDGYHYNTPSSVAVATDGSILLTEDYGHRLVKLTAEGVPVWTVGAAGVKGDWNDSNDRLNNPDDIAIDTNGRVYVASRWHHRVQIYNPDGSYHATVGNLNCPGGVGIAPNGYLYVADTCDHRVKIYDTSLALVATLGAGSPGSDNARFSSPEDVAVDGAGTIYVADRDNHRIQVFNADRTYLRTMGETGVSGNGFGQFNGPNGLFVDAANRLYAADEWNNRVQVFDASGAYLTTIGGSWGDQNGQFRSARGLAVAPEGTIYVADSNNHRIQKFAPSTPNWLQRNINGFGDRDRYISALAPFGGHLYAGTTKYVTRGAQIWRMDAAGNWNAVMTDGFGESTNVGIERLVEFKGRLYAGVESSIDNPPYTAGGEIWRSSNGATWEQMVDDGFDNLYNGGIFHMAVYSDQLYAGSWTYTNTLGAGIWRSSTGDAGDWTQVAANGFGDPGNRAILTMQEFDGYLYAGTRSYSPNGADIWRYDGVAWTPVVTDGFGYTDTYDIAALAVLGEYLYAGTGRYDPNTQSYPGGQLWRCTRASGCDEASDWSLVVADGFGKAANVNIAALHTFDHYLYAATYNVESGMEVWRTPDGVSWDQVGFAGLGDSNNAGPYWGNSLTTFNDSLYIGVYNRASAGKVWQYLRERATLNITDPTVAHTLVFTPTGGGRTTVLIPANAVDQPTELVYQPFTPATRPPNSAFAGRAFDLDAYRGDAPVANLQFQQPVTVIIEYTDADVAALDENTLMLYRWVPAMATWEDAACSAYVRQPAQNRISVPICNLSRFGLFGAMEYVYLPAVGR
jgi:hypothetical protein